MIKDLEQLKDLILWAKKEKVKSLSISDIKIEISDLAFIESLSASGAEISSEDDKKQVVKRDLFEAQDAAAVTDEDLFWSAR